MDETKRCNKCKEIRALTDYYPRKLAKDGREDRCKVCRRRDPLKERERSKRRRSDPIEGPKLAAIVKRWALANPDRIRAAGDKFKREKPERVREIGRAYAKAHPDRVHHKNCKRYGITQEEYERRFMEQRGLCALCDQPETHMRNGKPLNLAIDHDRRTGRVRRLLCHRCNTGLGSFRDSAALLRKAVAYIEEFEIMDMVNS